MGAIGTVIRGMRVTELNPARAILNPVYMRVEVKIPDIVRITGGTFRMGSSVLHESPIRTISLSDYGMGKYPVTNGEYLGYLQIMERKVPDLVADQALALHPVVNVSWNDATEYCKFLTEITGRNFNLPTEAQWEFAARGTEGRECPWGGASHEGRVNFNSSGTTPVDRYPDGATPSGIFDMSGNAWEWCADCYRTYAGDNLTDPQGPDSGNRKVLRGGSWAFNCPDYRRAAYRGNSDPGGRNGNIGFRVSERYIAMKIA
ncbi:MAG: SUMF1/EgtB/PvdO family nonheme iron enzyme [Candidatus Saganbacteria bacterium]|nr:SUMF1/EgtB/PvdO family nonheme iron enzyme [Candidatus Saganbacteria bacterium]